MKGSQERIKESYKYIPLDRLCLSLNVALHLVKSANQLTEEQQWAKLALVKENSS